MGVQFFGFSDLEDRQFRVVVYLVDVPILARLMGVQFFGFSDLEDRQFRVVVYLVDVPIVGSAFQLLAAFLMGVQHFSFSPAF